MEVGGEGGIKFEKQGVSNIEGVSNPLATVFYVPLSHSISVTIEDCFF